MPFKGIHGHVRHTHEDKVEAKKKGKKKPSKKDEPAVQKEAELYNQPGSFEPFKAEKPAHYLSRFFRRSAQTVVHCVLVLSPHSWMHTDELFDWMMPYERMGAWLSEDAEDYINRAKARQKALEKGEDKKEGATSESQQERPPSPNNLENIKHFNEYHDDLEDQERAVMQAQLKEHHQLYPESKNATIASYSSANPSNTSSSAPSSPTQSKSKLSSVFPQSAVNPCTDHDVQVNPKNPDEIVHSNMSHFHPPFLIVDSRRRDEYDESHIHGAVNVHFLLPNPRTGEKLDFELPKWVEKDTPIVTYCTVGLRSGLMVWELRRRGYKFVRVLSGGYYKWVNEGRPIYANSGELTKTVLQQHKLAGIMLRKELKSQRKCLEESNARVAQHHRSDSDWPDCHTYKNYMDPGRKASIVGRKASAIGIGPGADDDKAKEKQARKEEKLKRREMRRKSSIILERDYDKERELGPHHPTANSVVEPTM